MRARRILFVVPALPEVRVTHDRSVLQRRIFTLPYLGLLNLAAVTPPGYDVRIVNEHLVPLDFDAPADLVGITVMTPIAPRAYEIAAAFRRRGIPVVLGGLHPTNVVDEAARHCDCVVRGEAEQTWPDVLADFEAGRLQRVYDKRPPFDLAELPMPRRALVESEGNPFDAIQATRGCVYQCDFCSVHGFHDHTHRVRPVEHVVRELRDLKGRVVCFVDDHLTANREWALELFRAMVPLRKRWMSMASITIARDDELLRMARKSGCLGFFIGFETLRKENLDDMNKRQNRAFDYREAIRRMQRAGLGISAGTIYGCDQDGPDVFDATLRFAIACNLCLLQVSPVVPFPGTATHERYVAEGRDLDSDWAKYDFFNVTFTPKRMGREQLLAGMDSVRRRFYSWPSILKRVLCNAPNLGLYATAFNFFLNWAYRDNQRRGYRYPP